ncbi:MAG: hypothetical protein RR869_06580 [Lachnospiraceae bacterium]
MLEELLQSYENEKLMAIAKIHHVELMKEGEEVALAERVKEKILDPVEMQNFFLCTQTDEIEAFEMILQNAESAVPEEILSYLLVGGYCKREGADSFSIPWEVKEGYLEMNTKVFQVQRKRTERIANYCHAANNLYAVAPPSQVVVLFNQYEPEPVTEEEIISTYGILHLHRCNFVYEEGLFIDEKLIEDKRYVDLYQRQQNSPFYIPPKEEIEILAQYDQTAITEEMRTAAKYLMEELKAPEDAVIEACSILQIVIRKGGKLEDAMELLRDYRIQFQTEEQVETFVGLLVELWNHSRMVLNRGYTPAEMQEYE